MVRKNSTKTGDVSVFGKVEHRKMPEGRKFSPGQSGNPRGRPPHRRDFLEKLAEVDPSNGKSNAETILDQVARRARQGNKWHIQFLYEYALGRPLGQQLNVNVQSPYSELSDEELERALDKVKADLTAAAAPPLETPPPPPTPVLAQLSASQAADPPIPPQHDVLTARESAQLESERIQKEIERQLESDFITKLCGKGSLKPY